MSELLPVRPEDKRVVGGKTDINQLAPFRYPWAWDMFLKANNNHWTPTEINMAKDLSDYVHELTPEERHMYEHVLAYLTTSDIMVMRNLAIAIMEQITAPEIQIYYARQIYEESLHCYIEGTEVLTPQGWIALEDLEDDELVAQYTEVGAVEFVKPLGKTKDKFDGNLVRFKSAVYESIVTPNHRCVAIDPRKTNELVIKQAEEFAPGNYLIPVSGWKYGDCDKLSLLDKLSIAYQADGSLQNPESNDNTGTWYKFHFKRLDKILRLADLLDALNIKYTRTALGDDSTIFYIPKREITVELKKNFSWIDLEILDANWAREFIDELMYWDGSTSQNMKRYTTTCRSCYDIVVALAALSGYRAGVYEGETSTGTSFWQVNFVDRYYVSGASIEKSEFPYSGYVYSVGVPSTMLVVRYGNKVTISGNTWAYQHCIETLGLDQGHIYNLYRTVPEINRKIKMSQARTDALARGTADIRLLVLALIFYHTLFEGGWFYNGFTPIFGLQRRGLMQGTGEQFQYILRDESMHAAFGIKVINAIFHENVDAGFELHDSFKQEIYDMVHEVVDAETDYARVIIPDILGYDAASHVEQLKFILNRRMRQLGLDEQFPGAKCPFPWLDEQINIRKEKNFFETRVTEYQVGTQLDWVDDGEEAPWKMV